MVPEAPSKMDVLRGAIGCAHDLTLVTLGIRSVVIRLEVETLPWLGLSTVIAFVLSTA